MYSDFFLNKLAISIILMLQLNLLLNLQYIMSFKFSEFPNSQLRNAILIIIF